MKKNLLITMLALLGMSQMLAQEYEYVPFVREGVKWVYCYINSDDYYPANPNLPVGIVHLNLEFKGDTIIDGKTYKAMHKYYGDAINEESDTIPIYMREEDKIVYGIIPDRETYLDCPIANYAAPWEHNEALWSGKEVVMYDFNDPIMYYDNLFAGHDWYKYDDMITIGSHLAKRYVGMEYGIAPEFQLVEGIGIDGYSSYTLCLFMPMQVGGDILFCLSHVIEDGNIIYRSKYTDFDGIDEVVADGTARQMDGNYYDLMGRAVGKDVPSVPGIYIHQGKKICVGRMP